MIHVEQLFKVRVSEASLVVERVTFERDLYPDPLTSRLRFQWEDPEVPLGLILSENRMLIVFDPPVDAPPGYSGRFAVAGADPSGAMLWWQYDREEPS